MLESEVQEVKNGFHDFEVDEKVVAAKGATHVVEILRL